MIDCNLFKDLIGAGEKPEDAGLTALAQIIELAVHFQLCPHCSLWLLEVHIPRTQNKLPISDSDLEKMIGCSRLLISREESLMMALTCMTLIRARGV